MTDNDPARQFSAEQVVLLHQLRARYEEDGDRFSTSERAQLDFVRWLFRTGRVDCGSTAAESRPDELPAPSSGEDPDGTE